VISPWPSPRPPRSTTRTSRSPIDDKIAYLRIETDDELVLTRETIEEMLGRPFSMNDLEVDLASFAGRIDTGSRPRPLLLRHPSLRIEEEPAP
jgi:hypothetical protein